MGGPGARYDNISKNYNKESDVNRRYINSRFYA